MHPPQLSRPRRAARAPVRLGQQSQGQDENAPAAAGGSRVAVAPGKAVLAGKQAVVSAQPAGKVALQTQQPTQAARRAFGDVSNAQGAALRVRLGSFAQLGSAGLRALRVGGPAACCVAHTLI